MVTHQCRSGFVFNWNSSLGQTVYRLYLSPWRGTLIGISATRAHWLPAYMTAYLFSNIPFILVNGILTGSFGLEEVVWYNDAENLGSRLQEVVGLSWTQINIPLDDFVYSFALLLLNTAIYICTSSIVLQAQLNIKKVHQHTMRKGQYGNGN